MDTQIFGATSLLGGRSAQEDTHFTLTIGDELVCGLFDGHGGARGSRLASKIIPNHFTKAGNANPVDSITHSFSSVHQLIDEGVGGTTAVVAHRAENQLTCGWVGDSRCVIIGRSGVHTITTDHRPANEVERMRIIAHGGEIVAYPSRYGYVEYVSHLTSRGGLMMTRALGDHSFKPAGVIAAPDITTYQIKADDRWCCLLCDGVWESVSDDELTAIVKGKRSPQRLADAITNAALRNGSSDNITAVVMRL